MFDNPEIAIDQLPQTEGLDWQALHPSYVKVVRLQILIVLGIVAVAFAIPSVIPEVPWFIVFSLYAPLILIGGLSVTAVPFNRIQHVETSNTPFDRRYGIATLRLFTAGGSGADLKIDGLGKKAAEKLRVYILEKAGASIESA
jgi:membrane protein YdbS with pleckstrin-like domain